MMRKNSKRLLFGMIFLAALGISSSLVHVSKASADTTSSVNVYRLYNPNTGEHFYTDSYAEKALDVEMGWNDEGIGWQAPIKGAPVYRVYNPNAKGGDHYYTKSKYEAQSLVNKGWRWDNNAKPVFYSGGSTPIYVAYNPNAQSGAHNYTGNLYEENSLINAGWKYKAVAWNAVNVSAPVAISSSMNLTQIMQRNFSSILGTWKASGGEELVVTNDRMSYSPGGGKWYPSLTFDELGSASVGSPADWMDGQGHVVIFFTDMADYSPTTGYPSFNLYLAPKGLAVEGTDSSRDRIIRYDGDEMFPQNVGSLGQQAMYRQ